MTRSTILAKRIEEVLLNGRWIANTNYKAQLADVTWHQAIQKVKNLNSIAALTFHINYYLHGILNAFNGGELTIRDQYSFDLAPIHSEPDWQKLRTEFLTNAEKFVLVVEKMPDDKLDAVFIDEKYGTYLRNIEGVIEHAYYHLGQISLIKKLIKQNKE